MADSSSTASSAVYSMDSVVRGHHVYKEIWTSFIGEELSCKGEVGNIHDMYAVAVMKEVRGRATVVGHLPRQISTVCHLFLRRGGVIACHITNGRQYSIDFPQGGLEVPCKLIFSSKDKKLLDKTVPLLQKAPSCRLVVADSSTSAAAVSGAPTDQCSASCSAPISLIVQENEGQEEPNHDPLWICIGKCALLTSDKQCLLTTGQSLNDKHINAAHALLKKQFTNAVGLQSTLLQYKVLPIKMTVGLQIVHCNGCHWVTVFKEDKETNN